MMMDDRRQRHDMSSRRKARTRENQHATVFRKLQPASLALMLALGLSTFVLVQMSIDQIFQCSQLEIPGTHGRKVIIDPYISELWFDADNRLQKTKLAIIPHAIYTVASNDGEDEDELPNDPKQESKRPEPFARGHSKYSLGFDTKEADSGIGKPAFAHESREKTRNATTYEDIEPSLTSIAQQELELIWNSTDKLVNVTTNAIHGSAIKRTLDSGSVAGKATNEMHLVQTTTVPGEQDDDHQERGRRNPESIESKERMNIVLFYADDWTLKTLGALNPVVKTPNLDEMARNGVLFRQNCVTTSICWISRATLYTGMYGSRHKQLRLPDTNMFDKTVKWNDTLYPQLKASGYNVGFVGKWHSPMPDEYHDVTFDHSKFYFGDHWEMRNGQMRHVTDLNKQDALEYLRHRPKDQPFALTVSFFATHAWDGKDYPDQYMPMPYSESYYENITIPVPKSATEKHWDELPWFFTDRNEARKRWKQRFDTPEHYQVTMKRYYRMVSEVDDACGAIIEELKRQGVYNNTLLVFTTDNGNFHGEHGLADKWYPHEESVKVPLVIQDPRMHSSLRGQFNDEFTLSIDLAPTLLSAANIPVPQGMQGRNIAQMYIDPDTAGAATKAWRKDFFYEWNQGDSVNAVGHDPAEFNPAVFALISKRYKYMLWPQVAYEQLFNIQNDPWEEFDIYNSTKQTRNSRLEAVKARFRHLKYRSQHGLPV